jgi:hypothetical protein
VSLTAGLIAAGFLLVLLLIVRRIEKNNAGKEPAKPKRQVSRPVTQAAMARNPANKSSEFHAVAINCSDSACDAAKALLGKRFLSNDAPRLPLDECTVPTCECRFRHYADRRNAKNRRNQFAAGIGGDTGIHKQDERETKKDRRSAPDDDLF